jgi:MGT family glycosyltransferase
MSKSIAIFNLGAHGHVNPTLAVTRELLTRGFRVTYFCTESMGAEIRLTGAQFEPYESQFTAPQQAGPGGKVDSSETPIRLIYEALAVIPQLIEKTRALNPDLIIFDTMCLAGRLIGQRLGVDAIRFSTSYRSVHKFRNTRAQKNPFQKLFIKGHFL